MNPEGKKTTAQEVLAEGEALRKRIAESKEKMRLQKKIVEGKILTPSEEDTKLREMEIEADIISTLDLLEQEEVKLNSKFGSYDNSSREEIERFSAENDQYISNYEKVLRNLADKYGAEKVVNLIRKRQ